MLFTPVVSTPTTTQNSLITLVASFRAMTWEPHFRFRQFQLQSSFFLSSGWSLVQNSKSPYQQEVLPVTGPLGCACWLNWTRINKHKFRVLLLNFTNTKNVDWVVVLLTRTDYSEKEVLICIVWCSASSGFDSVVTSSCKRGFVPTGVNVFSLELNRSKATSTKPFQLLRSQGTKQHRLDHEALD